MNIWPKKAPNDLGHDVDEIIDIQKITLISQVTDPTIEVYLPSIANATGQAVLICPGGGYAVLAYDWEGTDIAKWLNSNGIAAIVLKYRLPLHDHQQNAQFTPLMDAQRALRFTRSKASEWNIDPDQIGVMGFSAGGHLASSLSVHYDHKTYEAIDEMDEYSARPDFSILMYPVISFAEDVTHGGSRKHLLGDVESSDPLMDFFTNNLQIKGNTPPAILVHSGDDLAVPVQNSILYYQGLLKAGVHAEMHIYPYGGHGYSLAINKGRLASWPQRVNDWLIEMQPKD